MLIDFIMVCGHDGARPSLIKWMPQQAAQPEGVSSQIVSLDNNHPMYYIVVREKLDTHHQIG